MLQPLYEQTIKPELLKELQVENVYEVPQLDRIVVHMGVGKYRDNEAYIKEAQDDLARITGQKPVLRKAHHAIAGFKLRQGDLVGMQVTLRGSQMWHFLERLVSIALPRVRDFRGISATSFDERGNYSMGITEHQVFPEIDTARSKYTKSLQVTIVTRNTASRESSLLLLTRLGMPFVKE